MNPWVKADHSLKSSLLGVDQHGAHSSQSDSDPSRPDLHSPPASSVPVHQPADLSRDWHQSSPGCERVAWQSGPCLWHHCVEDSHWRNSRVRVRVCLPIELIAFPPPPAPLKQVHQKTIGHSLTKQHWGHSRWHRRYSDFAHRFRESPFLDTFLNLKVYFPALLPAILLPNGSLLCTMPLKTLCWSIWSIFFLNASAKELSAGKSSWCINTQTSTTKHYSNIGKRFLSWLHLARKKTARKIYSWVS